MYGNIYPVAGGEHDSTFRIQNVDKFPGCLPGGGLRIDGQRRDRTD